MQLEKGQGTVASEGERGKPIRIFLVECVPQVRRLAGDGLEELRPRKVALREGEGRVETVVAVELNAAHGHRLLYHVRGHVGVYKA